MRWLALLLLPSLAAASPALDTQRLRPAETPRGGLMLEGTDLGEPWHLDVGLLLHGSRNPVLFTLDGEPTDPIVAGRFGATLSTGVNIGGRVRVGMQMPVVLVQQGVDPISHEPLPTGAPGDLRIVPTVQLLDPARRWLGLAISTPVSFPTGRADALLGEGLPTVHPRVIAEKRFAGPTRLLRFNVLAQVGFHVRPRTQLLDLDTTGALSFGLGLRWEPHDRIAVGTEGIADIGSGENARHGEWMTWGEATVDKRQQVAVRAGFAVGLGRGVGTPEGRVFAAVRATFDPRPRRHDPVPDLAAVSQVQPALDPGPQPPVPGEGAPGWGLRLLDRRPSIDARVLFETNSHRIRPEAQALLDEVARWVLTHERSGFLRIHGHADPRGAEPWNDKLSQARARSVLEFLERAGVPAERMEARGFGERRPSGQAGPPTTRWAADRRVEFELVAEGSSSPRSGSR